MEQTCSKSVFLKWLLRYLFFFVFLMLSVVLFLLLFFFSSIVRCLCCLDSSWAFFLFCSLPLLLLIPREPSCYFVTCCCLYCHRELLMLFLVIVTAFLHYHCYCFWLRLQAVTGVLVFRLIAKLNRLCERTSVRACRLKRATNWKHFNNTKLSLSLWPPQ